MQRGTGNLGILLVGVLVKSRGWKEGAHGRECPESEAIAITVRLTNGPKAELNKRQPHRHLNCDFHQKFVLPSAENRIGRQNATATLCKLRYSMEWQTLLRTKERATGLDACDLQASSFWEVGFARLRIPSHSTAS